MFAFFINMISGACEFCSPFLINYILDYIESKDIEQYWGFVYVAMLVITQAVSYLLFEHIIFQQVMIGVQSTNSLVVLIYDKLLKVSAATNKSFSQGEIVNFIQVDAEVLMQICFDMPTMIKFPIILTLSVIFLFYYLGLSFLSGIVVFIVAFIVNFILGIVSAYLWKAMMKTKDIRMNATTEALSNIKMIKFYGWTRTFEHRIAQRRDQELKRLAKAMVASCFVIACLYFFPQMLSAVVFTTYIGSGHSIDLKTTFMVITFFNLIKVIIDWLYL